MNIKKAIQSISIAAALLACTACTSQVAMNGGAPDGAVEIPPDLEIPLDVEVSADVEVAADFIVQATSAEAAADAVRNVGGIVTHELAIIRAVGATLDSAQLAALRNHKAVTRVYEDAPVTTSSSCSLAAGPAVFEDSKLYWTITNNGGSTVTIGSLSVSWPSVNSTLKKIKLGGDDIWDTGAEPPHLQIVSGWHDDLRRRELQPGESAQLMFEFDANIDWAEANYTIIVDFEQGCSVEFLPRIMDCRSRGSALREFKDKKIKWLLPNDGAEPITISEVSLNWPETNGQLKKMKLGSDDIFAEHRDAPVATIAHGWHADIKRRRIAAGNASSTRSGIRSSSNSRRDAAPSS